MKTRYMLRKQRKTSRRTSRPAILSVFWSSTGATFRSDLGLRSKKDCKEEQQKKINEDLVK